MNQIRIIQIVDSLNVGGTEVLAVNIANSISNYGVESHICSTRKEGFLKDKINKNVGFVSLKRKSTYDLMALVKLRKYLKSNRINVVYAHSTSLFFATFLKFITPELKLFWHNHTGANIYLKGFKLKSIKFFSKFFDGIINVNQELNLWAKNILKHQNTIHLNNFPLFIDLANNTNLLGNNKKRIVCLAALRPEKNHLYLIKSFQKNIETFPEWTLHLVGKDYNDEYSITIKKYLKDNNLESHVFIYNMRSDIRNILSQCDIGVLSSKYEGLPISLLEYGLIKLPVIVTDVGECKFVVKNDYSGFVVSKDDFSEMSNAFRKLILSNRKRIIFGEKLHNNVLKNFSNKKFVTELLKFITQKID